MAFFSTSSVIPILYLQKAQKESSKLITEINLSNEGIYVVDNSSLNRPENFLGIFWTFN